MTTVTTTVDRPSSLRMRRASALASLAPSLALAVALVPATGCFWVTTKSEGETLRKDVTVLRSRVDTKEKDLSEQIGQLQKILDNANRAGANLGADLDSLRTDIRAANGLATAANNSVNELRQSIDTYRKATDARLDALEQRIVQIESGKATAQSSPDELWKLGTTAFQAQRYNEAIDIFKRLSQTYPTHEHASEAVYFRGQSYTNLKDWDHAIGVYQQLYEKYPDSPLADDGLYFAAVAAQQLKNCTEARAYLGVIKQKYPKSNVTKQADDLDKVLKRDLKNKAKCNA